MKTRIVLSGILMAAAFPLAARAGTLFYVPVPAAGSDAQSGLDSTKVYTNAVAAGNRKEAGRNVNGVPLTALPASGNSNAANGVTISAATGTLANGGGKSDSIKADGAMSDLLAGMIFNDGAGDNSEQYVVLDPAKLAPGKTYDLRVYVCNASGENRQVNLSFAGDGKPAVNTDFFNEDDATTSAGGFTDPNQVYYINYRFTWDGVSTPGFTATQKFGSTPFCLYAVTNEEVGAAVEAQPAGAVTQVAPEPIAEAPRSSISRTGAVDYEDDIGVASEVFYNSDTLRDHGRWVNVGTYGRCWHPADVDEDWQPYTRGRWVYSNDDGWVWDSDEDFGWATYHYGRWFREENAGWFWVPGRVWAPAWVSWRHGHSFVGWAPLPPLALAAAGIGIGSWADHRWGIGPHAYNFVNVRDFGARSMAKVLIPRQQNAAVMTNTVNVTNVAHSKHGIFNGGPSFQALNNALVRSGGAAIPTVSVSRKTGTKAVTPDGKFSHLSAGVLSVAAPTVTRAKKSAALPPVATTIASPKFDKGWNGLTDPTHATALQAKIAGETPGAKAKTAPARLPGAIVSAGVATATSSTSPLKSFRPGKPPGTPGTPPPTAFVKPGLPVNSAVIATPQPLQPTTPIVGNKKKPGSKTTGTNVPGTPPVTPGNPVVIVPPKPGKPGTPASVTQPATIPSTAQPTVPKPTAVPTPEPIRAKKGKPQPATPGTDPVIKPAPTPEPVRIPKRTVPVATPAPAPIKPTATPKPEPPRIPKRVAPKPTPAPAPVAKPVPVPVRPAPVVIPPKPAPVAPTAPKGKPTPTPAPTNG